MTDRATYHFSTRRIDKLLMLALAGLLALSTAGHAQAPQPSPDQRIAEQQAAWKDGFTVAVKAGQIATLRDQGGILVPQGMVFIPTPQAARLMRSMGNRSNPELIGLVTSVSDEEEWIAPISFTREGYVKDDDAASWSADDLLAGLKEGTEENNKDRRQRGFPDLEVTGWIEKPSYDRAAHRLVWSAGVKDKDSSGDGALSINYKTYALGRDGYISVNFITTADLIEKEKPLARQILSAIEFAPTKRYTDFNPSTDKVAAYGLAALIGGIGLKKAGLFAGIAAFVAKFAKAGVFFVIALGAGLYSLIRRRKATS